LNREFDSRARGLIGQRAASLAYPRTPLRALDPERQKYRQKLAKRHIAADAALEEDRPLRYRRSSLSAIVLSR
jgi:hypothetical protein